METQEVIERYVDAVNTGDPAKVAEVLTEDCKIEAPGAALQGSDQVTAWMKVFFDAFPDIYHVHDEIKVDGNVATTVLHITGTHTAPLVSPEGAIPATGRSVKFDAHNRMMVRDDRVELIHTDFDQVDFMRQLGVG